MTNGVMYYYVESAVNSAGESLLNSDEVSATPLVTKLDQTITFALGPTVAKESVDPAFTDAATASSGLPAAYSSDNESVATVDAVTGLVTIKGLGTAHILANQEGNASYNPAPQASQTLTVTKGTPVITWANPANIVVGTPLSGTQLNATTTVPGVFTYTPPDSTVLAVGSGQILHVDFVPEDPVTFNNSAKDVTINVVPIVTTTITTLDVCNYSGQN